MKLKSLILGSVAAAGLSTAGYAADLGVLTSLDVCDALGLSGLTISSDTNCLQITGGVSYEFRWGDYRYSAPADDLIIGTTPLGTVGTISDSDDFPGIGESELDYETKVEAWLQFVGTADSDFGPAKATIKLKSIDQERFTNEGDAGAGGAIEEVDDQRFDIDEAYVSIGDSTVIMAGKKGTIGNFGDSEPFNFLKTFGYTEVDSGVLIEGDEDELGGHVIQIVSDLGNGVNVGLGLENLEGDTGGERIGGTATLPGGNDPDEAGTLVGVVSYTGEAITAHVTGLAYGVLDGDVETWAVHAGATGTFDVFKIRGAVGYLTSEIAGVDSERLHALLSAEASFDIFKIALSGEYARAETAGVTDEGFGLGGSIGLNVTEGVAINLGARYFDSELDSLAAPLDDQDILQVAAQLVFAATESVKLTGEVGAYYSSDYPLADGLFYGAAEVAWAPGGGFTSSLKGEVTSEGAYRATFKAAKTFE